MARRTDVGDSRRTDTRDRILSVALRLFADRGYANTSLREIAEELGVTKAALYFHFKTKEEIITGILRDYLSGLDSLLDGVGVGGPPATLAGREQLLRRFADLQAAWGGDLTKLVRQNYTEISNLPTGADIRESQRRLADFLAGPDPSVLDQIRAVTSLAAIQSAAFVATPDGADEQPRRDAALTVALEVLRAGGPGRQQSQTRSGSPATTGSASLPRPAASDRRNSPIAGRPG
jgi:AcrR family transcriptional regulator